MRTTLSLDDDLAKSIENFRKRKNLSLREVVNQLLREGLQATSNEHPSRPLPSWSALFRTCFPFSVEVGYRSEPNESAG